MLKAKAKARGLKAQDLAYHCGVSLTTVKMWYNHTRRPSVDHLIQLSELLSCRIDDLFEETDPSDDTT
ncbi:helix-turn-helix transcriptional regulator [Phaeodactylibacter sp.]|uniref:helix-turn-helix domain-containing protein n=1 Tax=Phaeodactylibacter sp. TaxID=1940289 RepID=UPI0025F253C1|nr:helix-turn-helix transcriptional regulator [Phaeodactylibacter sp.]MCI4647572.1 helix-turn-helix transcriptional regulator [Phaeodactylibacter sp.]